MLTLLGVFLNQQATKYSSFLSEPKSKCYFVKGHGLLRQSCIASVRQPLLGLFDARRQLTLAQVCVCTALCSCLYVQCVCGGSKMQTPTMFVHHEIVCFLITKHT